MKSPNIETSRKVEIDYTIVARAFAENLAPVLENDGKKFKFGYLSGKGANRDKEKDLRFLKDTRNIKEFFPHLWGIDDPY